MTPAAMTNTESKVERGGTVDAVRRAAHLSHEVRLAKSLAADALVEAGHAARQTVKTVKRRLQDLTDRRHEVAHQVRREPFKAIGIAFGAGVLLGAVTAVVYRAVRYGAKKGA
jgi:ElaB/YqjD/DUF883 family membrane-anchored ribosome-binding protein